ncbi:Protein of unknown function, partial [Gryllus bimaculatus]
GAAAAAAGAEPEDVEEGACPPLPLQPPPQAVDAPALLAAERTSFLYRLLEGVKKAP